LSELCLPGAVLPQKMRGTSAAPCRGVLLLCVASQRNAKSVSLPPAARWRGDGSPPVLGAAAPAQRPPQAPKDRLLKRKKGKRSPMRGD